MKMKIEDVAKLARIRLDEKEKDKLGKDLEGILAYVEKLNELDTKAVQPTSHALPLENVFRKDEIKRQDVKEEVLKHAPSREGGFFKVPKVIEE